MIMGTWGGSMQISVWLGQGIKYQWQDTDDIAGNTGTGSGKGLGTEWGSLDRTRVITVCAGWDSVPPKCMSAWNLRVRPYMEIRALQA